MPLLRPRPQASTESVFNLGEVAEVPPTPSSQHVVQGAPVQPGIAGKPGDGLAIERGPERNGQRRDRLRLRRRVISQFGPLGPASHPSPWRLTRAGSTTARHAPTVRHRGEMLPYSVAFCSYCRYIPTSGRAVEMDEMYGKEFCVRILRIAGVNAPLLCTPEVLTMGGPDA